MRERARDKGRLEDIIEYSDNVTKFISGHTFETFVADKRTYYSVMKNVEVVGEAAYMLSKAFKKTHPKTPWKTVQGMRHVLVHDYAMLLQQHSTTPPSTVSPNYANRWRSTSQKQTGRHGLPRLTILKNLLMKVWQKSPAT